MTRCQVLERIGDLVAMRKGANCFLSPFMQNKNTLPFLHLIFRIEGGGSLGMSEGS